MTELSQKVIFNSLSKQKKDLIMDTLGANEDLHNIMMEDIDIFNFFISTKII